MADKKKAKARLEDLEVNEVSIVDSGANNRKYLIVKNKEGDLSLMENPMADQIVTEVKKEQSLAELLFDGEGWDNAPAVVSKSSVHEAVTKIVGRLSKAAGAAKGQESAPEALAKELGVIADTVDALATQLDAEILQKSVDIPDDEFESLVVSAVEVLVKSINSVNQLADDATEIPEDITKSLHVVSSTIRKALKPIVPVVEEVAPVVVVETPVVAPIEKKQEEDLLGFKVLKAVGEVDEEGELLVVIKAGAKMKQVRLSKFREAVSRLVKILSELEGDFQQTTKQTEVVVSAGFEDIKKQLEVMTKQHADTQEALVVLQKKQALIEEENPGSNGAPPEETSVPIEKKENLFSNIIG